MTKSKRPKIGLALGSGGARGIAHIGVIKILEENHIPIDYIAGTSIGALVGGFFAAGLDIKEIERLSLETNWRKVFSFLDPRLTQSLIGGEKVKTFINEQIGSKTFEECRIPFTAVATDLKNGEIVSMNTGDMASAIRASISIPLVFKPVETFDKLLADGGLSAPVPVEIVRNMGADIVIAVNLNKHYCDEDWKPGWYNIADNSLNILQHHLAQFNVRNADLVIDINAGQSSWYDFVNGKDKIAIGEKAAEDILPKLRELIAEKRGGWSLKKIISWFRS
ncbi:MAG: patatin-like phospholipase family protein [Candidatus Paceibacterota bacterium]|jgi:NTE family protein|nr:patatin-like phospholipase family protein [Candidatus Paceibacterota bacterium]